MEVILLEKVLKLGSAGEIVNVKPGYARNFLLPLKKALRATNDNKAKYEEQRKNLEIENNKKIEAAKSQIKDIENIFVPQIRQAGEDGRLFGSVTTKDIVAEIANKFKIELSKNQIILEKAIKYIGIYNATIFLHPEVSTSIKINVARSLDEAEEAKKSLSKENKDTKEA